MERLEGVCHAEAAIVGGSITGLLLASSLSLAGMKVCLVDARDSPAADEYCIASMLGARGLTRAEAIHGLDTARLYASGLQTQLHALLNAPLPYVRKTPGYTYALEDGLPQLDMQHALLLRLQSPVSIAPDAGGCPFPVSLSMMAGAAVISMAAWQEALVAAIRRQGGRIYFGSRVIGMRDGQIITRHGCVEAPQIVWTIGKPPGLRQKALLALLESRRQVRCTLTGGTPLYSCQQPVDEHGLTFYPVPEGITALWDASRLGMPAQQERLCAFERTLHRLLPDWSSGEFQYTQAVISLDGLPFIGQLPEPQMLYISGTDGDGVLSAMLAAEVMARRILGHARPDDMLYRPDRHIPEVFLRAQTQHLTRIRLRSMLRRKAPVCTHCGCRMRYSIAVQCWECPLCGSCYTMLGQLLCGPGIADAQASVRQRPNL